jgi:hypothetical protein
MESFVVCKPVTNHVPDLQISIRGFKFASWYRTLVQGQLQSPYMIHIIGLSLTRGYITISVAWWAAGRLAHVLSEAHHAAEVRSERLYSDVGRIGADCVSAEV